VATKVHENAQKGAPRNTQCFENESYESKLICSLAFVLKTALVKAPARRRAVCSSFAFFAFFAVNNCCAEQQ